MPVIDLGPVVGPQGPQGATGATGAQGIQGLPGPSQVTATTSTNLTGVLYGNGNNVGVATVDSTPTENSTNLISSGGVAAAGANKLSLSQTAYVETGTTASRAYSAGQYLTINGVLYRVTTAIASGATLTPGTNCVAVTVGGELFGLWGRSWYPNGESLLNVPMGIYRTSPNNLPSEGLPINQYGALIIGGVGYPFIIYINTSGGVLIWGDNNKKWYQITTAVIN